MTMSLNLSSLIGKISDRELEILSRDNPDARLETNSQGQLIFMSPQSVRSDRRKTTGNVITLRGGETGDRNLELAFQIKLWNKQSRLGKVFDSSTGFRLSNDAIRSPDVSWIPLAQGNSLTPQQKRKYLPLDPYFVIELMSPSDILSNAQNKMREYMSCGVEFGWLINPDDRQVEIYCQGQEKEVFNNPQTLSGEDMMSGLIVDLAEIFD